MKGGKLERVISIEKCAKQRLQVPVYANSLLVNYLWEEGIGREKTERRMT
jgi:hypothetical protein